jgi:hypothetical protein
MGGVYKDSDDPPWNDPHTAAPALWAFRIEDGLQYELSVAECELEYNLDRAVVFFSHNIYFQ